MFVRNFAMSRRLDSRSIRRAKRNFKKLPSNRLGLEALEPRQMLSATPLKFYVVDDAAVNRSYRYDAAGAAIGNTTLATANASPRGSASMIGIDKTWVVDANRNVFVYDATGGLLGSWTAGTLASNATPEGIATDGTDIWIVDSKSDKVFRYAGAAGRVSGSQTAAGSFNLNSSNSTAKDIVTDGASLWVVDNGSRTDKVFKYTIEGAYIGSWTIDSANKTPTGLALDPANIGDIWIADSGTDRVYKYSAAVSRSSGSQSASASFTLASGNANPQGITVAGRPYAESPHGIGWVQQFGTVGDELGRGVGADPTGKVYLSGQTTGSLANSNPNGDITPYLAAFNSDGSQEWITQREVIAGANFAGTRVAADGLGNMFQVGDLYQGSNSIPFISNYDLQGNRRWTIDLPNGENVFGVAVDGLGFAYTSTYTGNNVLVRKFDADGNELWLTQLPFGTSFGIDADGAGNIYVSGYTSGSGGTDGWVARLSDAGSITWTRQFGSAGIDYVWDVAADGAGNVYTVGQTKGALGGPNAGGDFDVFVTKHDAAGTLQWIRQSGTSSDEALNGVWADDAGNVYAAGWTRGALGGPSLGGMADIVVAKYATDGELRWAQQIGTAGRDAANDIKGDESGNLYVAGNTRSSWSAPNAGGADAVLIKLSPPYASTNGNTLDSLGESAALISAADSTSSETAIGMTTIRPAERSRSAPARRPTNFSANAQASEDFNLLIGSRPAFEPADSAADDSGESVATENTAAIDAAFSTLGDRRWAEIALAI
jgi:hypothetical protein